MKKKSKKTDKPGNPEEHPIPASPMSFGLRLLANNTLAHIACLTVLILIIYSNTLNAPFQWDEGKFIVDNPIIKDLHYFTNPSEAKGFELYGHLMERYIGYLTFALNYRLHDLSVTGYHIVNIAIHIANSILVYFLVLLTFETPFFLIKTDSRFTSHVSRPLSDSQSLIALFSSMLFAVHPLQTEAVTYVFQRFVPLAALFSLMSLTAYVRSRLAEDKQQRLLFYCVAFISAVLAMKTKEIAFTLPLVITLYEFCFFSRFTSRVSRFLYLAPMLLTMSIIPLTLMYLKGTMSAGKQHLPGVTYAVLSRGEYMLTQFRVIVTYLRLLFIPVAQNFDYDYPVFKSVFDPQVILSFLFLSALFGLGVYFIRSSRITNHDSRPLRLIGFGIMWFFITLSVESSIVLLDRVIDEYRVYLPSAGVSIGVVTGAFLLMGRMQSLRARKAILVLLVFAAGTLSVATYLRNEVWGDTIKLWEDTARKSPAKESIHNNLGNGYQAHSMLDKALEQYLIAIKLKPDYAEAHNNLGSIYKSLNMPEKAIEQYLIAIKLKPGAAESHYNLGVFYQAQNMFDKAMEQYLIAVKLKPDYIEAHDNLGNIYLTFNMPDKAMEQYLIAIKLNSDLAEAHFNLGYLYYRMGQMENARRELMTGLKTRPDDQQAQQLLQAVPSH